ncbi:hypothetical protein [Paraburkholderia bannensis]|uniref:hypothetical protein n=1 Tax=Paraburkholderia bannensis TaxID=765414 RepID=UPI002ABD9D44|nr:hypothetical protein [Paraburkholderia bannensis]
MNLITGDDNSIGKSTLARLPLWTLGCQFEFETTWVAFDVRTLLKLTIDGVDFFVTRHRHVVRIRTESTGWERFEVGSDEFERYFANLFGFGVLLPRRNEIWIHEVPSPEHYFSAFYVDQLRGWAEPWSSFKLWKYDSWRRPVISFHVGYLSGEYFQTDADIAKGKQEIENEDELIDKYGRAVEVLKLLAPEEEIHTTDSELDSAINDVQNSMVAVKRREQRALSVLSAKQEELEVTKVQIGIAKAAVEELEKDYEFATEQLTEDVLVCPLCGTKHDNTLLERASFLQDRAQASQQVLALNERRAKIESAINVTLGRLEKVRQDLAKLNRKFRRVDKDVSVKSILESMGTDSVRRRAQLETALARERRIGINKKLVDKKQELIELIEPEHEENINSYYRSELRDLCKNLRINASFDISTATPLSYKKLSAAGGGADASRLQLAYHLATHRIIRHFKTEILAPLILDTPNQQDQGALNYSLVSAEIKRRATKDTQVIVCATRHKDMALLEKGSHVVELSAKRLLSQEMFDRFQASFQRWFSEEI